MVAKLCFARISNSNFKGPQPPSNSRTPFPTHRPSQADAMGAPLSGGAAMKQVIRATADKCARRPCAVVGVMVLISLIGASGLSFAEFESDGYKLWVPTKSFAYERWTESIELFGEGGRGGTMLFTADDVLTAPALTDILTARAY